MANKTDVINRVAEKLSISKKLSKKTVDTVIDTIIEMVNTEKSISLSGFGRFYEVNKPERIARNPKTGEPVDVPEKIMFKFRSSKLLEKEVITSVS